ncbi:unnamed protein product [Sphagnum jensenii]
MMCMLQLMQFRLPVPQMRQSLDESHKLSSREVNELGQFMRTPAPVQVQAFEAFQHQQLLQQQQQHLQNQRSFPGHPQYDSQEIYGFSHKVSERPGMKPHTHVNTFESHQLQRERSLSALTALTSLDSLKGLPMELVTQIQEQKQ